MWALPCFITKLYAHKARTTLYESNPDAKQHVSLRTLNISACGESKLGGTNHYSHTSQHHSKAHQLRNRAQLPFFLSKQPMTVGRNLSYEARPTCFFKELSQYP